MCITHHLMLGLVTLRLKVEVVLECVVTALADGGQDNGHVKLAPTLLVDAKGWLLNDCFRINMIVRMQRVPRHSPCLFFSNDGCKL